MSRQMQSSENQVQNKTEQKYKAPEHANLKYLKNSQVPYQHLAIVHTPSILQQSDTHYTGTFQSQHSPFSV